MIMTAHVVFPAIDPTHPATLSHAAVTGLLRGTLGYRGVIVSDDLDMKAIADPAAAAVAAIRAGCDVLLLCNNEETQNSVERALVAEVARDPAFRARVGESAARVRAMKREHAERGHVRPGREIVGSAEHRALAARLARR
jgi:beta-N-acetylhexosaminidase